MKDFALKDFISAMIKNQSAPGAPFVFEHNDSLSLHFDLCAIQSQMSFKEPDRLVLSYTRTMMGFLLLNASPKRIGMIGLGGGSMPKYCYRHLPDCHVTIAEINPDVIALREKFQVPPNNSRFEVLCMDGAAYVHHQSGSLDVLIVDGFEGSCVPSQLSSQSFYDDCYECLEDGGVMVANLCREDAKFSAYVERIRKSFEGAVTIVLSEDCFNRVIFARKGSGLFLNEEALIERAEKLEMMHDLRFLYIAKQIIRNKSINLSVVQ
ncbi:fused MFS/spermidine synthase [Pseudogulbenkiania subflava]|nr:fused MFS/spermidine synthase [Pseudogulbenkiania subflava]